jgi:C1A family cysteine protease
LRYYANIFGYGTAKIGACVKERVVLTEWCEDARQTNHQFDHQKISGPHNYTIWRHSLASTLLELTTPHICGGILNYGGYLGQMLLEK